MTKNKQLTVFNFISRCIGQLSPGCMYCKLVRKKTVKKNLNMKVIISHIILSLLTHKFVEIKVRNILPHDMIEKMTIQYFTLFNRISN